MTVNIAREVALEEIVNVPPGGLFALFKPDLEQVAKERAETRAALAETLRLSGSSIEARIAAAVARIREGSLICGLLTVRAFIFYSWFYKRDWAIVPDVQVALGLSDEQIATEKVQISREQGVGHLIAAPQALSDFHLGDTADTGEARGLGLSQ